MEASAPSGACAAKACASSTGAVRLTAKRSLEARALERADLVLVELAGIVDQQCERAESRRRRDQPAHRLGIGEIGEHHRGAATLRRNFTGKIFGLGARMVGVQHHGIAVMRQRERNRPADAPPRPGDQRRARHL